MKADSNALPPELRRPSLSTDDGQLLRRYVDERSQEAFAEVVRRHVNVVYFAALRRVGGDAHLADDVAQQVFADLARKAPALRDRKILTGWLYTSTRFAAAQTVRSEQRRRTHEQEAQTMRELELMPYLDWNQLRPVIDDVLDELSEPEREAVLLRFFENLPLAEVGARFSLSADAARMRVERALDKLRGQLARRGIASTSAALATVFAAQSGAAVPAHLVSKIVADAVGAAGAIATPAASVALWKIVAGATVGALGIGLVAFEAMRLREPASTIAEATAGYESIVTPVEFAATKTADVSPQDVAATTPVPAATPSGGVSAVNPFDELTLRQRNILKTLWEHRKIAPAAPPAGWSFKLSPLVSPTVAAEFEQAAGQLDAKGLVRVNGKTGAVALTDEGDAFCRAHAAELDAIQLKLGPSVPAWFGSLPASEKDILKTLWEHQKVSPDQPSRHWGFKLSANAADFPAFEAAVAGLNEVNGLVGVSAKTGVVFLNDRGRFFCETHAAEIDAYPAPARVFRPLSLEKQNPSTAP